MPLMIQNRTMTVVGSQPASSKWWCSGAMRNTRRPVPVRIRVNLNQPVWMIDESRAFRDDLKPRNPEILRRCSMKFMNAMKALNQQQLEATLMPWVTQENIRTLLVRRDWMVKFFENKANTDGKEAIFTDMPIKTPQVTIP